MKQLTITVLAVALLAACIATPAFAGKPILWDEITFTAQRAVQTDTQVQQLEAEGYKLTIIIPRYNRGHQGPAAGHNYSVFFVFAKTAADFRTTSKSATVNIEVVKSPGQVESIRVTSIDIK